MSLPSAHVTENTRIAGWMSALFATATFSYLQNAYFRLPIVMPVSFAEGNPDQFAFKSPALVFLPFILQVALGAIFAAVAVIVLQQGRRSLSPASRAASRHAAEGVSLLAMVWIGFQAVNAWRLINLYRHTYDVNIEVYVLALTTAVTATVVIGARVLMQVNGTGAEEAAHRTVLTERSQLAAAVLAAVLAVGIGAPLYLLSVVWTDLRLI